jgi:hypothetical protein
VRDISTFAIDIRQVRFNERACPANFLLDGDTRLLEIAVHSADLFP